MCKKPKCSIVRQLEKGLDFRGDISEDGSIPSDLPPWGNCDNLFLLLFVSSFKPQVSTSSMGTFPKQVKIVEVGPRDGLQNEKVMLEINQRSVFEP